MLSENSLKSKLINHEAVFGILNLIPSPVICEMLAYAGFGFAIKGTEYLLISDETLAHRIRAADCAGLPLLVRVPDDNQARIGKILDAGAAGIVGSRVSSLKITKNIISAAKYPPIGQRGITSGRNTGFGTLPLRRYIDMIIEGALDLSLSLGYGTQVTHPDVQAQIQKIAQLCQAKNITFCAIPRTPE